MPDLAFLPSLEHDCYKIEPEKYLPVLHSHQIDKRPAIPQWQKGFDLFDQQVFQVLVTIFFTIISYSKTILYMPILQFSII